MNSEERVNHNIQNHTHKVKICIWILFTCLFVCILLKTWCYGYSFFTNFQGLVFSCVNISGLLIPQWTYSNCAQGEDNID